MDNLNLWLFHGRATRQEYHRTLNKMDEFLHLDKMRPALQRFREKHLGDTPCTITRREAVASMQGRSVHTYDGGYVELLMRPPDMHDWDIQIQRCRLCP